MLTKHNTMGVGFQCKYQELDVFPIYSKHDRKPNQGLLQSVELISGNAFIPQIVNVGDLIRE